MVDQPWIELKDLRRRRYANLTWIPLYLEREQREGNYGSVNYKYDVEAVRTLAVSLAYKSEVETWGFSRLNNRYAPKTWDGYVEVGEERDADGGLIGTHLVMLQDLDGIAEQQLHISQDLVFALELLRERDVWVRPADAYAEVIKIERKPTGALAGVFIRPDYLKDYLCARGMALRIESYRERRAATKLRLDISWDQDHWTEQTQDGDFRFSISEVAEGDGPFSGSFSLFTIARTETFEPDEVPQLGPPTDENTIGETRHYEHKGPKIFDLDGERRLGEWLDPGATSPIVKRDDVPSHVRFIVGAAGETASADELNDEDIGKWLFFSAEVVPALKKVRGVSSRWYTLHTGGIGSPAWPPVHFGINSEDLIVCYAYDVARLPEWERRIWSAYSVPPSGGLPPELEAAQIRTEPANTKAPEAYLEAARDALDTAVEKRWGTRAFRPHPEEKSIIAAVSRFRSLERSGFLSLAKDLARLTADSIDAASMHGIAPPGAGESKGSLKSLERVVAMIVGAEQARKLLAPLVGVYELRHGDAHLPSSTIEEAFRLVGVEDTESWLTRGTILIHNVVSSLFLLSYAIDPDHPSRT